MRCFEESNQVRVFLKRLWIYSLDVLRPASDYGQYPVKLHFSYYQQVLTSSVKDVTGLVYSWCWIWPCWVLPTRHCLVVPLTRWVAASVLNKQAQGDDKGWPSVCEVQWRSNNSPWRMNVVPKCCKRPRRTWTCALEWSTRVVPKVMSNFFFFCMRTGNSRRRIVRW